MLADPAQRAEAVAEPVKPAKVRIVRDELLEFAAAIEAGEAYIGRLVEKRREPLQV